MNKRLPLTQFDFDELVFSSGSHLLNADTYITDLTQNHCELVFTRLLFNIEEGYRKSQTFSDRANEYFAHPEKWVDYLMSVIIQELPFFLQFNVPQFRQTLLILLSGLSYMLRTFHCHTKSLDDDDWDIDDGGLPLNHPQIVSYCYISNIGTLLTDKYNIFETIFNEYYTKMVAAHIIQKQWRRAISDPRYTCCKRRLMREAAELSDLA